MKEWMLKQMRANPETPVTNREWLLLGWAMFILFLAFLVTTIVVELDLRALRDDMPDSCSQILKGDIQP